MPAPFNPFPTGDPRSRVPRATFVVMRGLPVIGNRIRDLQARQQRALAAGRTGDATRLSRMIDRIIGEAHRRGIDTSGGF